MATVEKGGFRGIVIGMACVLVALSGLIVVAVLYYRRTAMCFITARCQNVAIAAIAMGLIGSVLLIRGVANPTRR
jgi:hypothetical protein